jgi:hypothetical protein
MDILNSLYLKSLGLIRTTAEPGSIVFVSTPDSRRDDKFLTIAVPIENLASVIGALETVAVDGVTITGDGTPGNPLTVNIAGTGLVDSVTDDGIGWVTVDNTDPENPIISFAGVAVDGVTITGTGLAGDPLVAAIPAPTAVIIKAAFAQADFATDVDALAAPLGQSLVVTDYTVSGFGGTFTRISTLNSTFLDWAVLATDNTAVVGLYGNAPL